MIRGLYLVAGLALTGLGIAGFILPGIPGTIFLILALGCFKNCSPKMEAWLLNNRYLGPSLRDWEENRWMRKRIKIIAITCIVLAVTGSLFSPGFNRVGKGILGVLGVIGVATILRTKTKPE